MPDTFLRLPNPSYPEKSAFTVTAYFRDSADAADTPTTIHYRIDDMTSRTNIVGWTSVTPGTSAAITVTGPNNSMVSNRNNWERRQITVAADKGLSTETRDTAEYRLINNGGFDE